MKNRYEKFAAEFKTMGIVRKSGSQWCIFSKSGKKLECFSTKKDAVKRLREIEFFKNQDKNK